MMKSIVKHLYTEEKKKWGPGEWQDEPDLETFSYNGYDCILWRNLMGVWCGYVGLPKGHKYYGWSYTDLDGIAAHGGLTFSGESVFAGYENGLWWIGFDCGHLDDKSPASIYYNSSREARAMRKRMPKSTILDHYQKAPYRNIEFARQGCKCIVDQLNKDNVEYWKLSKI